MYSALHHNNCMFIAYHVIIIDKAFRQKLLPECGTTTSSEEQEPRLAELVPKMRRIGNDDFSEYLDTRKTQLCQLVTSANGKQSSSVMILGRAVFVRFSLGWSAFRLATSDYSGHGGCQIGTVE